MPLLRPLLSVQVKQVSPTGIQTVFKIAQDASERLGQDTQTRK
jgi:hypothetical protein